MVSVRLRTKDLEGVLAFASDAHDADAPEPLTTELLDRLTALVGCTYATYQEFDWSRRLVTTYVRCSNEDPLTVPPPYVREEYWTADDWPYRSEPPFEKVSDRLDRRERERVRDEEEFNAEFRIVDRIGFRVGDRGPRHGWLHFDTDGRDFDERDRELIFARASCRGALAERRRSHAARGAARGARPRRNSCRASPRPAKAGRTNRLQDRGGRPATRRVVRHPERPAAPAACRLACARAS
jgi:hypothetical protein